MNLEGNESLPTCVESLLDESLYLQPVVSDEELPQNRKNKLH